MLTADAGDLAIMSVPPSVAVAVIWPLLMDPSTGVRGAASLMAKKHRTQVIMHMPAVSVMTCGYSINNHSLHLLLFAA